jgi:23S rRNA pseudouridine2605 synthase
VIPLPRALKRGRWEEMDEAAVRNLLQQCGLGKPPVQQGQGQSQGRQHSSQRSAGGKGSSSQQQWQPGNLQGNNSQGRAQAKGRPRQPDPLQTALGFAGMAHPQRAKGPGRRSGGQGGQGGPAGPQAPRRKFRP